MASGTVQFRAHRSTDGLLIEGEVRTAGGAQIPFVGWLALLAALESAAAEIDMDANGGAVIELKGER